MSSKSTWTDPESGKVYQWSGPLTEMTKVSIKGLPGVNALGTLDNFSQGTLISAMIKSGVQFDQGGPDHRVSGFRRG